MTKDFFESDFAQRAFLGKRLSDLLGLVNMQAEAVYRNNGVDIPVVVSSTLITLYESGPISMADIAGILKHPHQTIAQHLAILDKSGLIEKRRDPDDRRRSEINLTEKGCVQAVRLEACLEAIASAYETTYKEIGISLSDLIVRMQEALLDKPLTVRTSVDPAFKRSEL